MNGGRQAQRGPSRWNLSFHLFLSAAKRWKRDTAMSVQFVRRTESNLQNFEIQKMFTRRGSDKCWNVPFVKRRLVADRHSRLLSELMLLTIKSI